MPSYPRPARPPALSMPRRLAFTAARNSRELQEELRRGLSPHGGAGARVSGTLRRTMTHVRGLRGAAVSRDSSKRLPSASIPHRRTVRLLLPILFVVAAAAAIGSTGSA